LSCVAEKTHGKHFFAERFFAVRLGKNTLKAPLCHAPEKMRTANTRAHGKYGVCLGI
jgi:hypothetical protein